MFTKGLQKVHGVSGCYTTPLAENACRKAQPSTGILWAKLAILPHANEEKTHRTAGKRAEGYFLVLIPAASAQSFLVNPLCCPRYTKPPGKDLNPIYTGGLCSTGRLSAP